MGSTWMGAKVESEGLLRFWTELVLADWGHVVFGFRCTFQYPNELGRRMSNKVWSSLYLLLIGVPVSPILTSAHLAIRCKACVRFACFDIMMR